MRREPPGRVPCATGSGTGQPPWSLAAHGRYGGAEDQSDGMEGWRAGCGRWMVACDGGQAARGSNIKIHLRGGGGGERSMPRGRRGARVSGFQLILYHGNTMLTVRSKMEGKE